MELLSLISVIGIALGWQRWRGCTAASAVLHAVSSMLILLFLGALIGLLWPTTLLLMAAGLLLAFFAGRRYLVLRKAIPVPVGVFAILCVAYWLVQSGSAFFYYDEYSHWGVFLREMLSLDQLWGADTNSMHPRYLPGAALWQYFFAVFSRNPEGAAYLAQFVLLIAPLIVLWEKTGWRQTYWHLGILALLIIAAHNFGHGFTSIYVDHILGAWFAGVVLNFLFCMKYIKAPELLSFLLPVAVIVLLKSTGVFFALAATGIMTALLFAHTEPGSARLTLAQRFRQAALLPVAAAILCVSILFVWSVNRSSIEPATNGTTTAGVFNRLVAHESIFDAAQQAELTRRYVDVVFHQQISKDSISAKYNAFNYRLMPQYKKDFRLTTASMLSLSFISLLMLVLFVIPAANRHLWIIAAGGTLLTAVAYIAVLYLGYRYVSADTNGFKMSSYVRYAQSMLLPVVLLSFAPLLPAFASIDQWQLKIGSRLKIGRSTLVFALALAALYVFERPYLRPLYTPQLAPEFRTQFDPITSQLREKIGPARLWVFYPDTAANSFAGQILQYQLSPGRVYVEHDAEVLLGDPGKLKSELKNWEYLWYVTGSPELDIAFQRLLGETPTERVYKIDSSDGGVRFEPVHDVFSDDGS